ncbi:YggT family protein [Hugonella massiliensis]|uniref:YggT family protein n=1 Tax=Hugonella massiliensis TaxID=1720315 RepID=UPI00073E493D|nr:YggT family protein [Hugonella massiliensis]MDD6730461.1 YggT family protein [Eggerthellaceae bacterium]
MISRIIVELGNAYSLIIVIYCVLTWIPITHDGVLADIRLFFEKICEPYLGLFKKLIPPIGGTVDITPIIALVVLQLAVDFLAWLL